MSGRPLRFLAIALLGWTGLRVAMVWPTVESPTDIPRLLLPDLIALRDQPAGVRPSPSVATIALFPSHRTMPVAAGHPPLAKPAWIRPDPDRIALAMLGLLSIGPSRPVDGGIEPQVIASPSPVGPTPLRSTVDRWSASAWLVIRGGRGIAPGTSGGQLGGGQAGVRIAYAVGSTRRVAIVGRVATPLAGKGREAALGVEWRPWSVPVRLVAEQLVALDGGKGGPAAGVVAGTGPAPLIAGFSLESYGQAGVIRRQRAEPYADGAARVARPIARIGRATLDLGLGGWGGAQRDAARLDLGPTLGARLPIGEAGMRVALDWRQRVAGRAAPASGLALTIGGDF